MRIRIVLFSFLTLLAVSSTVAFLGYHYLGLASEYRQRNFVHLDAVQRSLDLARSKPLLASADIQILSENVARAQAQAVWCTETLSPLETLAFQALGAEPALAICRSDAVLTQEMLTILDRFDPAATPYIAADAAIIEPLLAMRTESRQFNPYVDQIEARLMTAVRVGTLATTLGLMLVLVVVGRQMLRFWSLQDEQSIEIRKMSERFTLGMEAASDGFALFDADRRLIACNLLYRELAHPDPSAVRVGMRVEDIIESAIKAGHYAMEAEDARTFLATHTQRMESGVPEVQFELVGDRHVKVKLNESEFGDKVVTRIDVTAEVRAARKQQEYAQSLRLARDELQAQSLTDPLTGLPNRRQLDSALRERMAQGPMPIIRIDLDRFKQVNDILGHAAGDYVLRHVARTLRDNIRRDDLVARVGGDEFVVLCPSGTNEADATKLANRLLGKITRPLFFENKRCMFGASFGIAMSDGEERDPGTALSNADAALYKAKKQGRGTVEVFTPKMLAVAREERELADRFSTALQNNEFEPFLQSQHDAQSWKMAGVEVLARWRHPQKGVLAPNAFLHIAQQLGLEAELDAAIFHRTLASLDTIKLAGIDVPRVAFNVSAARILDPMFTQAVENSIKTNRDQFAFEIVESISYEQSGDALSVVIDSFKEMGFQIDVDDFGSEHASINSILRIKPDAVKIDRAIINHLGDNDHATLMATSILDLAHSMGAKVIAEGVDTLAKAEILKKNGCDLLQGFFFTRPMPINQFIDTFRTSPVERSGFAK